MIEYQHLTDVQLKAKIGQIAEAIEKIALGEHMIVIAGEGRRMEVMKANLPEIKSILAKYKAAYYARYPQEQRGRAIGVSFSG